ncbi:hypothetical protein ACFE04_016837 [Oxalis oulophora]
MSSIGATCAGVYLLQKSQREKMKKKLREERLRNGENVNVVEERNDHVGKDNKKTSKRSVDKDVLQQSTARGSSSALKVNLICSVIEHSLPLSLSLTSLTNASKLSSRRRSIQRIPRQATTQTSAFLSSRKEYSTASQNNAKPTGNPPEPNSLYQRFVLGTGLLAGGFFAAYQTGYLDPYIKKPEHRPIKDGSDDKDTQKIVVETSITPISKESQPLGLSPSVEHTEEVVTQIDLPLVEIEQNVDVHHVENLSQTKDGNLSHFEEKTQVVHVEDNLPVQQQDFIENSSNNVPSDGQTTNLGTSVDENLEDKSPDSKTDTEQNVLSEAASASTHVSTAGEKSETMLKPLQIITEDKQEIVAVEEEQGPSSLLEAYDLNDESTLNSFNKLDNNNHLLEETEAFVNAIEEIRDDYLSKDGKVIFDFLQAIHAAEKKQAEEDARVFAEEKRALKEKYEKEIRDLRARELMHIEEVEILDKELKREQTKAIAAIKSFQEKMEEKLRIELEQKEIEAEMKYRKAQELAKAELAAAIASEKAAQIEKIAEANLHINALCMAFYARSEEARKSHSVHKLALGALALEDALSKGLPIQKEIDALNIYLEGIDKDSALDLVLSSLPEETRYKGTDTLLQLNQKFNDLQGTLRLFSLIPAGGGGILTHSLAHLASWLKIKNVDESGDGIESVIGKVENYLAEGKLSEAANTLEEAVKGSRAEDIVREWVNRARNRAITEQALTVLESYATCISLT